MVRIFPSLISADILNLKQEIETLEPHCDGFHLDVMDNHFVPNLTLGAAIVNAIGSVAIKPLWVHLMVQDPLSIINRLHIAPGSIITIHQENHGNKRAMIQRIKDLNYKASMAINPSTPVHDLMPYVQDLDQALIMSVEPGFSGQDFMPEATEKIAPLAAYKREHNASFAIGMDGGVGLENIAILAEKGITDFGIASAIFGTKKPLAALEQLKARV